MIAFLTGYYADRVEFVVLTEDGRQRAATVLRPEVGLSFKTLEFPHVASDAGDSLGSEWRDQALRLQAWAEIVRHTAAVKAATS
jgi:hypothetical protein